jgi:hypothetical protein
MTFWAQFWGTFWLKSLKALLELKLEELFDLPLKWLFELNLQVEAIWEGFTAAKKKGHLHTWGQVL